MTSPKEQEEEPEEEDRMDVEKPANVEAQD